MNNLNQAEFIDYQTDNSIIPNKVIPQEFEELIENKLNNLIKAKFDNFIKTDFINIVKAEFNNLIDEPSPYNKMTSLYTKLIDYNMKSTTSLTDHMELIEDNMNYFTDHMKDLTSAESHYTEMQELDTNNYNQDDNNIILGGIDDAGLVEVN